jgi:hypothetical protein
MTGSPEPVLWLRDRAELDGRGLHRALLYPAYELTALVFAREPETDDLDPFERAALGACSAHVVSVDEQAEALNLDANFVRHLQARLRDRGLIDATGRPARAVSLAAPKAEQAVHLYWDPFAGSLWPRYVRHQRQRRLTVTHDDSGQLEAVVGTDGSHHRIALHRVTVDREHEPANVTPEDAIRAIRAWSRDLRRYRMAPAPEIITDPSVDVVGAWSLVYLACPVGSAQRSGVWASDPFGAATWPTFTRGLERLMTQRPELARWLGASSDNGSAAGAAQDLVAEVEALGARAVRETRATRNQGRRTPSAPRQALLDLEQVIHRVIDRLEAQAPHQRADTGRVPASYYSPAAVKYGFDLTGQARSLLAAPGAAPGGGSGLAARCIALLRHYSPDSPGALHNVAAACPQLFTILAQLASRDFAKHIADVVALASGIATGIERPLGSRPSISIPHEDGTEDVQEQENEEQGQRRQAEREPAADPAEPGTGSDDSARQTAGYTDA